MKWSFREKQQLSAAAIGGLTLAIVAVALAVSAGAGSRLSWWQFGIGFLLLRWGVYVAIAAAVLSLLGIFASRPSSNKRGLIRSVFALFVSLPVIIVPLLWLNTARSVPPIHDISTDTENPPQFHDVLPLRADAPNSAQYGGPEIAAQQREAYPDIQSLDLNTTPEAAFAAALKTANTLGWDIVSKNPQQGRIEATDTTFWFGFKDDVVIRVMSRDGGSRVDIRSVSRVGRSDVGTNAARIRAFLRQLHNNISQ